MDSQRLPLRILSYTPADVPVRWGRLALVSLLFAILSFPIGAGTSIAMHMMPNLFSRSIAERGGFLLFAVGEGIAAATGCLAWVNLSSQTPSARRSLWLARIATLCGVIGSAFVLGLIFVGAIQ